MPIIGNGDIASVLDDVLGILFFASGVSNSRCIDESEYDRDCGMLIRHLRNTGTIQFVYFSSIACQFYINGGRYPDPISR